MLFSPPLSSIHTYTHTHTHTHTHTQAVISDCVQLMAARAKAADISISLNVVGEVSTRSHTHTHTHTHTHYTTLHYTMPFDTPTKQCCCADHRLYNINGKKTVAHPVLREHDTHYKHFHCLKNLSPSLPPSLKPLRCTWSTSQPTPTHHRHWLLWWRRSTP